MQKQVASLKFTVFTFLTVRVRLRIGHEGNRVIHAI